MESTSKFFEKIVYATLDRLRKAGDVVKIEGNWALPQWYPALMRAGIGENGQKPKRRGRPRKGISKAGGRKSLPATSDVRKEDQGRHPAKLSERITELLKEHPKEEFTAKQLSERFGIHAKVISMTMGTIMKKGEISLSAPGTYIASKFGGNTKCPKPKKSMNYRMWFPKRRAGALVIPSKRSRGIERER